MGKERMYLQENDRGYRFWELCSGSHNHIKTRIWVHRSLVQTDDKRGPFIEVPIQGKVFRTQKGSLVIRPAEGWWTYYAEIPSGYRGDAGILAVEGPKADFVVEGEKYHSPQGRLGLTAWAVVQAKGPIEVRGTRTGRRVSQNKVAFRLTPDGNREELITDPEVCDLLE